MTERTTSLAMWAADVAEGLRHGAGHGLIPKGSTEALVPESCREDGRAIRSELGRLVVEQEAQQQVVVDEEDAGAQARSGSSAAATLGGERPVAS
ncbi:MAG TPA: hypothetical protein VGR26_13620 [Acidimicrobiales bacterium]|nr:hypothetical protein [Acidimicrobiales bacterium]